MKKTVIVVPDQQAEEDMESHRAEAARRNDGAAPKERHPFTNVVPLRSDPMNQREAIRTFGNAVTRFRDGNVLPRRLSIQQPSVKHCGM